MKDKSAGHKKGRGAQVNVPNKFMNHRVDTADDDGIDDYSERTVRTEVFFESPKNIISTNDSPDLGWSHSINPYQGCEHGCIYCYARNSHEYWGFSAGLDFESKIIVKKNAPQLLERKLLGKHWKPVPVMLSGNTDCYQPLERKFKITRQLLQVFNKYQNPVAVITKNSLILRDIDILAELAQNNLVHVAISVTTLNEDLRLKLEPRTASGIKRLSTVRKLADAGVPVIVMMSPIIPGLNHHEIPALVQQAAIHGASGVTYTTVRLNGAIGEIFKDWLHKTYPLRAEKVWNQIQWLHDGAVNDSEWGRRMSGEGLLAESISNLFKVSVRKYLPEVEIPPLDTTKFRTHGNYRLF